MSYRRCRGRDKLKEIGMSSEQGEMSIKDGEGI